MTGVPSPHSAEGGVAAIRAQERLPKPELRPSPGLGEWLRTMGGSIAFTTYQTSRLFFLFADDADRTMAQERIIGSAMGLAVGPDSLWVSNKEQIWRYSNVGSRRIKDEDWQAVFMPRKGYLVGGCDIHDIVSGSRFGDTNYELVFVNTLYSCIAAIDFHYGFRPLWKPEFISALSPEDRCHLNGLGTKDGEIAFATLCGRFDTPLGWKATKNGGGMVIDVRDNQVLCQGLSMPHSPRWHRGKLWLLNSGDGDFGYLDGNTFVPVLLCAGFARGLCFVGDYAVIGLSTLRENTFASGLNVKARLAERHIPQRCGLIVVDLNTGKVAHWLTITGVISELYDVAFLPGITRPYTPGFSEPALHRGMPHVSPGIFPLASPRFASEDGASPSQTNGAEP